MTLARRKLVSATAAAALVGLGACGAQPLPPTLPPDAVPLAAGPGALYRPRARPATVERGLPVAGMRCSRSHVSTFGAHVELIVERRIVLVPAGIGQAPPLRSRNGRITGARCSYPLLTRDPTGLVEVTRGAPRFLGDLFELWGQPLDARRVDGFVARGGARVRAFVDGRPSRASLRRVPLRRHATVVLELGPHVPPHPRYVFPPGL